MLFYFSIFFFLLTAHVQQADLKKQQQKRSTKESHVFCCLSVSTPKQTEAKWCVDEKLAARWRRRREEERGRGEGGGEERGGEGVQLKSQCGWDLVLWGLNVCGRGTELIGVFFCCKFTLHRFLLGGKSSRSLFNMPTLSRLRTFEAKSHGLLAVFSLTLR